MRLIDCKRNPRVHFGMTMKRYTILLPCVALELVRYMLLLLKLPETLGDSVSSLTPFLLRLLASPNLLFPAMFFFLWWDGKSNAAFKPLLLIGKAVSFSASALFLLRLFTLGTKPAGLPILFAILACMLVDMVTVIILITMPKPEKPATPTLAEPSGASIETVVDI